MTVTSQKSQIHSHCEICAANEWHIHWAELTHLAIYQIHLALHLTQATDMIYSGLGYRRGVILTGTIMILQWVIKVQSVIICHIAYCNIAMLKLLKCTYSCEFKVVQAFTAQDKPASFPAPISAT